MKLPRILQSTSRSRNLSALFILQSLLLLFACHHSALAQQPQKPLRLGKVEVVGLERYTEEQVLAASGLQLGQPVDIQAIDEAANRLMSSGLFKKLSYRFRSAGAQGAIVTFQVEEAKETIPVVFDNFVWFTDQELQEAIRREIPSFDGTAPTSGDMPDAIKKALQKLLNERKIAGHVEYLSSADEAGGHASYRFSIQGLRMPVCSLSFPGATDVKESELVNKSRPLFQQDYSRGDIQTFARINLLPLYRERGHLRASFLEPVVKPNSDAECSGGVSVTMQVDEGPIYVWERAEWSGNTVLTAEELSSALGMKPGERANGVKIDKGLKLVSDAYGKRGYVETRINATPELDDTNRRVTYCYNITEGPLYRMGTLEIKGLPEELAERLKSSWVLQPSDAFDTSSGERFLKKVAPEIAAGRGRLPDSHVEYKLNRDNRTVNVIIEFK